MKINKIFKYFINVELKNVIFNILLITLFECINFAIYV